MKQKFTLLAFVLTSLAVIKYANLTSRPQSTPTGGYAGEPANNRTCASSGCHSGTTIVDSSQFTIKMATTLGGLQDATSLVTPATTFIPGTTYSMSLQLNGTGNRYGFSLASLNSSNTQAGTFAVTNATTTTTVTGASGITNMSHKNANTTKSWVWQWTAPSSLNAVNFYYSGMLANGNGNEAGDIVYKSSVSITGASNGVDNLEGVTALHVFPTQTNANISLNIEAVKSSEATILLVNMTGQVVKELFVGKFSEGQNNLLFNLSEIPSGNYILNLKSSTNSIAKHIIKL